MIKKLETILVSSIVFLSGLTCILDYIFTIENGNIHIYIYDIGWINLILLTSLMFIISRKKDIN